MDERTYDVQPSERAQSSGSAASHAFEDHTGEIRLRLTAPSLGELFAEAGRALAALAAGEVPLPQPDSEAERVSLTARDREALLVDWLNELVFRSETERKLFVDFRFARLTDRELEADIRGASVTEMRTLVKAATLHGLQVTESSHGVSASVILDV